MSVLVVLVLHIAHTSEWNDDRFNMHVTMCIFDSLFIINFVIVIIFSPFLWTQPSPGYLLFFFVRLFLLSNFLFFISSYLYNFVWAFACYLNQPTVDWLNEYLYFVCLTSLTGSFLNESNEKFNKCSVFGYFVNDVKPLWFFSIHLEKILLILNTCSRLTEIRAQMSPDNIRRSSISFVSIDTLFFVIFDLLFHYRSYY